MTTIDQNLYSRQIGVLGLEAQTRLTQLKVFLHGLKGPGIEIAKNLILAGPAKVVINDNGIVEMRDLGSNFYLRETDVGVRSRGEASLERLKCLNEHVQVDLHTKEVNTTFLKQFNVVVFTDIYEIERLIHYNEACRKNKIGFIYAGLLGLYSYVFVDFGSNFEILDPNGENNNSALITDIIKDEKTLISLLEGSLKNFSAGDFVKIKEVEGIDELNGKIFEINQMGDKNSITINFDSRLCGNYIRGGIIEQVKTPIQKKFESLKYNLINFTQKVEHVQELVDFSKLGNSQQLHLSLLGIFEFYKQYKMLPQLNDENDAMILIKIVKKIVENIIVQNPDFKIIINEKIIKDVSFFARAQITTNSSFIGGIVGQEIIKYTGKFTPLFQFLHFDSFETLPEQPTKKPILGNRYDDFVSIYGDQALENLQKKRIFMVGAGALGCEFLKSFALLGISSQFPGLLHVTDDDNIEMSNLNRQFLFNKDHIGKSKSKTACFIASRINPSIILEPYTMKVSPETEDFFGDSFWDDIDYVITAVDNVNARIYLNSRCIFYEKPMLESGTLGTKCHSEIIIPYATQTYNDVKQPNEESSIPLCTLKNFPYQIEHTIQWARDYFEGEFVEGGAECIKFLEDRKVYLEKTFQELKEKTLTLRKRLEIIDRLAGTFEKNSFFACIELARILYEDLFVNNILQLIKNFPLDHKNESGQLFWSGSKRPPQIVYFDKEDPLCLKFIVSTANLYAYLFGIDYCDDESLIKNFIDKVELPIFQIKKLDAKNLEENKEAEETNDDDDLIIQNLYTKLSEMDLKNFSHMKGIIFEKDDDTNFHIDFIASVANLRARNYKIQEEERLKIKIIVGKIIPAMATTTAMVVGAVVNEILKLNLKKPIENFKNSFMNLALPFWIFTQPNAPIQEKDKEMDEIMLGPVKAIPPGFTAWDRIELKGLQTLQSIIDYFKEIYKVKVTIITTRKISLYSQYQQDPNMNSKLKKTIADLYEELSGKPFSPNQKYLELEFAGELINEQIDVKMPFGRLHLK